LNSRTRPVTYSERTEVSIGLVPTTAYSTSNVSAQTVTSNRLGLGGPAPKRQGPEQAVNISLYACLADHCRTRVCVCLSVVLHQHQQQLEPPPSDVAASVYCMRIVYLSAFSPAQPSLILSQLQRLIGPVELGRKKFRVIRDSNQTRHYAWQLN